MLLNRQYSHFEKIENAVVEIKTGSRSDTYQIHITYIMSQVTVNDDFTNAVAAKVATTMKKANDEGFEKIIKTLVTEMHGLAQQISVMTTQIAALQQSVNTAKATKPRATTRKAAAATNGVAPVINKIANKNVYFHTQFRSDPAFRKQFTSKDINKDTLAAYAKAHTTLTEWEKANPTAPTEAKELSKHNKAHDQLLNALNAVGRKIYTEYVADFKKPKADQKFTEIYSKYLKLYEDARTANEEAQKKQDRPDQKEKDATTDEEPATK